MDLDLNRTNYVIKIIFFTLVIFLAGKLSFSMTLDLVSLLWLPTGISIVTLLLQGKKFWPGIMIGIFLANVSTGVGWQFSLGAALANTLEAWLATELINHWEVRYQLDRVRDVVGFLLAVAVIAPLLASLVGTTSYITFVNAQNDFLTVGWHWWLGDAMGGLVIAPLLLSWGSEDKSLPGHPLMIGLGFSLVVVLDLFLFGVIETQFLDLQTYPLYYICFPFLIVAAFSLQQRGASTALFFTVAIALWGIVRETSPFLKESMEDNLLMLWWFISIASLSTLFLSAAVAENRFAQNHLEYLAFHDALTGLPNRRAFCTQVNQFLEQCQAEGNQADCAVLFLDLNRFKEINDSFGHTLGDKLLYQVSQRLAQSIPQKINLAHLGGDNFIFFIPSVNYTTEPDLLCEQILEHLQAEFYIEDFTFSIGATIGIVLSGDYNRKAEELIQEAEIAMYHAKSRQKKHCQLTPNRKEKVQSRLRLDQALHKALSKQELSVVYQPIVDLSSTRVIGFETLLRWYHPQLGSVSPARFIPLAEQTELIVEMGEWVLNQACAQLQQWQDLPEEDSVSLSVNVAPKQLREGNLAQRVQDLIKYYSINPKLLKLEITETGVLENKSQKVLEDLKAMGVGLYLDDFGTGESSLSRLSQLPLDVVKIDKGFVQGIPDNQRKSAIAQAIIHLAGHMDLAVVAEGIETEAQRTQLLVWGCEMGQGFLFNRPLTPEAATELIGLSYSQWC